MKRILPLAILFGAALAGCHAPLSVNRDALIGTYLYHSENPESQASGFELDRLTLQDDGHFELVRGAATNRRTDSRGSWTFLTSGNQGPEVLLEHSGYPVVIEGAEVRLMVDYDTGEWFSKTG